MIICIKLKDNNVTERHISGLFERYGKVNSATVSQDCAYVHMSNTKEAGTAIEALDGSYIHSKIIHVKKANRPLSNRINISYQLGLMRLI